MKPKIRISYSKYFVEVFFNFNEVKKEVIINQFKHLYYFQSKLLRCYHDYCGKAVIQFKRPKELM